MYNYQGNKVITRHKELIPIAENIYAAFCKKDTYENADNDMFSVVAAIRGVYFHMGYYSRCDLYNNKYKKHFIENRDEWIERVKKNALNEGYITALEIQVFEKLGEDTTLLRQVREARLQKKEQEREERRRREQDAIQERKHHEQEYIDKCKRRFLAGDMISGEDFIKIANRDGFTIHIRTKGTLRKRITKLNNKRELWYSKIRGKKAPDTIGCFRVIENYLRFLQAQ